MKNSQTAKQFITPFENISSCLPDERLSTALVLARSSHDPVFVIDGNGVFKGLLSLKNALFQHRFPLSTKVKNCLQQPPEITNETSIESIAKYMLATDLYTLPVVDERKNIIGLVSTPVILRKLVKNSGYFSEIATKIKASRPGSVMSDISIEEAYNQFRREGQSRLLLMDTNGKIVGILTRQDVERVLPDKHTKERISGSPDSNGRTTLIAGSSTASRKSPSAIEFASKSVVLIPNSEGNVSAVIKMLKMDVPSVVIVDKFNKPKGVISTRSVLEAITEAKTETDVPIIFHHAPEGPTREYRMRQLNEILQNFSRKINKRNPVERVELSIEESKNSVGKVVNYGVRLRLLLWSGETYVASSDSFVARTKHLGLEMNVRSAIKEIISQLEKHQSKLLGHN